MSGHTPGPWRLEPESDKAGWRICGATSEVAHLYLFGPTTGGPSTVAEGTANARLIAAAPELLTALREFSDSAARLDAVINGAESPASEAECLAQAAALSRDLVARARAALAKAGA